MLSRIQDNLEYVLADYADARAIPHGSKSLLWQAFKNLEKAFTSYPPLLRRPNLRIEWNVGEGNWVDVPWLAVLDGRKTSTVQRGVYCMYIFRQDMSGLYLIFNQGITEMRNKHGRVKARKLLKVSAARLRRRMCGDLPKYGFRLDDEIDLRAGLHLGTDYKHSTIAYKLYRLDEVPDDEALLEDLSTNR